MNEQGVHSDPSKLVGNAFRLRAPGTLVYLDYQGAEGAAHDDITRIEAVNALDDIPEIGGNSLSVDPFGQPM